MASRLRNAAIGGATALGLLSLAYTGGKEGLRLTTYRDVVGVWTGCFGETKGMGPNMAFSRAECDAKFLPRLVEHEQGMRGCLKAPDAIPDKSYITFVDLTYNVGIGAFCKSSVANLINAGRLADACRAMGAFVRGGGRVIQGLVNRRRDNIALCLVGAGK